MGQEYLQYLTAGAHESLSPGDTATGITAAIRRPANTSAFYPQDAVAALISVEDNDARFAIDSTTPTNSNGTSADTGHKITAGQSYVVEGEKSVKDFLILDAVSGANAVIKITTYFRR